MRDIGAMVKNGDITIEKLKSGDYFSRTRNQAIARAFKERGIIEQYVSGISKINTACKERIIQKSNVGANELHELIKKNQPLKTKQITQKTVKRWLKQLKDEKKIEFRGSSKTGGYWSKDD